MEKKVQWIAKWIKPEKDIGDVVPLFFKDFGLRKEVKKAELYITALGVYEASLNGMRIGDFLLAPGWTTYEKRLQYQTYDITDLLMEENHLEVMVGKGWYRSRLGPEGPDFLHVKRQKQYQQNPAGLIAQLEITYMDDDTEIMITDSNWYVSESKIRFSEIYDGEVYDATFTEKDFAKATVFDGPDNTLIPQQGEKIVAQEQLSPARIFTTPKGEKVIDFGQEVTGYVEVAVGAAEGDVVDISFAEVMDKNGNFYNENYRSAKCQYHYTCKDGFQIWHPQLTFYGFRYIRVNRFPGGTDSVTVDSFRAVALYSDMKRIGYIRSSNNLLNKLFDNCVWGQKCNFVDVPTDCPQRDERLGWTGDAQVFAKTACLNFDVEKFFVKWLSDMAADQHKDGYVGHVIPDIWEAPKPCAAWADASTICPWEVYMAYGNKQILENQFECMKNWVDYITSTTTTPYLWTGGEQLGDWVSLDAPQGSYKGLSDDVLIASAYYAYSVSLVVKAGNILGKDVTGYENLYQKIVETFQITFTEYHTQTECAVAVYFHLAKDCQKVSDLLAEMVRANGTKIQTGFVGTPYLLYALSEYGHTDVAYDLLLRKDFPSWFYPVLKGATTIWEHWDGIMENGDFLDPFMNSFNHYAFGSVISWVYNVSAGIQTREDAPGYQKVRIAPVPDARLDWLDASIDTRYGKITSAWRKEQDFWRYEITTPVEAKIVIDGKEYEKEAGTHYFYSVIK